MNYYIETYQNGYQILGSDFTKIVKGCKSIIKLQNAIKLHKNSLESLKSIKPYLCNGYEIKVIPFN